MAGEPRHISLFATRLWNDKVARKCIILGTKQRRGGGVLLTEKTITNTKFMLYISKDSDVSQSHQSKSICTVNHLSICQRFSVGGDSRFCFSFFIRTCLQGQWLARGTVSKMVEDNSGLIISAQASPGIQSNRSCKCIILIKFPKMKVNSYRIILC